MDFPIALALLSLFAATFLSNFIARRRDRSFSFDAITLEARELLLQERAAPIPLGPTLTAAHWARLEAAQPTWRRQVFEATRSRYLEARAAVARSELDGELYYPNPVEVSGAAHALLVLTERF